MSYVCAQLDGSTPPVCEDWVEAIVYGDPVWPDLVEVMGALLFFVVVCWGLRQLLYLFYRRIF